MAENEGGSFRYTNPAVVHYGGGCVADRLDGELETTFRGQSTRWPPRATPRPTTCWRSCTRRS